MVVEQAYAQRVLHLIIPLEASSANARTCGGNEALCASAPVISPFVRLVDHTYWE
jgi:hypothetical protein